MTHTHCSDAFLACHAFWPFFFCKCVSACQNHFTLTNIRFSVTKYFVARLVEIIIRQKATTKPQQRSAEAKLISYEQTHPHTQLHTHMWAPTTTTRQFKVEILAQQLKLSFIILNNSHIASLILVHGGLTDALRAVQVSLFDKVVFWNLTIFN